MKIKKSHYLLVLLAGLLIYFVLSSDSLPELHVNNTDTRNADIKSYLDQLAAESVYPGIQYMVLDKDGVLFEYATGHAVVGGEAMSLQHPMMIYSATKEFTAAAILRLEQQGKLGLDDDLKHYLPNIPYEGITIRQVLSHTSGIPDPVLGNMYIHVEGEDFDKAELLREVLARNNELKFPPGSDFAYSNLGYALLGELIEKLGHQSYESFIQAEILNPLHMDNTQAGFGFDGFEHDSRGYIKRNSLMNLAMGFMIDNLTPKTVGKWKTYEEHWTLNYPAHGGLIATAPGMAKFLQDQLQDSSKILSAQQYKEFYELQREAWSKIIGSSDIALSWFYNGDAEHPFYFHEGSGFGYVAEMRLYREAGIASILLVNTTRMPHKELMNSIDQKFIPVKQE